MENATEAFKMGFAVLVFVAALSLAIFSFTKVRETSANLIKQSDIKEYYQSLALDATGVSSNNALSSRVVGVETVVPTLYRYYKENYTILFYTGEGYDESNGTFTSITPMILYYTETSNSPDYSYLDQSTLTVSSHKNEQVINQVGEQISSEVGILFLYSDFKKHDGYKRSIELSKQFNLYRQNYCGCRFSLRRDFEIR